MKNKLILIGGGIHCESCIDVIEQENKFEIVGILDNNDNLGKKVLGYDIIGTDEELPNIRKSIDYFFIAIGHVKTPEPRIRIYNILKKLNAILPIIVSPLAYISKHAFIQEGTIVLPFSIVDVNASIGKNCIINHGTTVAHQAIIGDHCHISANCVVGKCQIGTGSFIGGNSWVTNGITIADFSVVGSGSNVIKNIEDEGSIYVGNPARRIK